MGPLNLVLKVRQTLKPRSTGPRPPILVLGVQGTLKPRFKGPPDPQTWWTHSPATPVYIVLLCIWCESVMGTNPQVTNPNQIRFHPSISKINPNPNPLFWKSTNPNPDLNPPISKSGFESTTNPLF